MSSDSVNLPECQKGARENGKKEKEEKGHTGHDQDGGKPARGGAKSGGKREVLSSQSRATRERQGNAPRSLTITL